MKKDLIKNEIENFILWHTINTHERQYLIECLEEYLETIDENGETI